jgi:hypothetical protein
MCTIKSAYSTHIYSRLLTFLSNGVDRKYQGKCETALYIASENGFTELVNWLLSQGADVNKNIKPAW